ncbi:MAG TPA: hypothetical protein VFJ03_03505 [Candidatus Limnocylindria bacterium]|nr:hypothetical protein [Candidatus Limnocylindria bacterium]
MPELRSQPYRHEPPRRPANLARRTEPPPQRQAPPDLRYLVYAGVILAAVFVALASPYLIAYLLQVINGG